MIWQVADFSGVLVLTHCVMTNHLHVLIQVPAVESDQISDEELLRRASVLYPPVNRPNTTMLARLETALSESGSARAAARQRLLNRMHDVSEFMKTLKQRFTVWFNARHNRFGTLWAERFKSLLVEEERDSLLTIAAYIDLNPVRAGLVDSAQEYAFNGIGSALAGQRTARSGITTIVSYLAGTTIDPEIALRSYSDGLSSDSEQTIADSDRGQLARPRTSSDFHTKRNPALSNGRLLGTPAFISLHLGNSCIKSRFSRPFEHGPPDLVVAHRIRKR